MQLITGRFTTILATAVATVSLAAVTVAPAVAPTAAIAGKKSKKKQRKRCKRHHGTWKHGKCHKKKKRTKPKIVTVNDYYFNPDNVTIKKGHAIKWVWSSDNIATHNVHLDKGPKKLKHKKHYNSGSATSNATFTRTFKTPGTYHFECTFHVGMTLTVKVKR